MRGAESAETPNKDVFSLSCTWQDTLGIGKAEKEALPVVSGEATTFECDVTSSDKARNISLLLVGKQIDVRGGTDAVAASVEFGVDTFKKTALTFPAVHLPGEYQYVFALFDTQTKLPVGKELVLDGAMEGNLQSQIMIDRVSLEREHYDWADPFTLTVAVNIPEGVDVKTTQPRVHVTMNNMNGEECAVLTEDQDVTQAENVYQLRFPKEGKCVNAVRVSLSDKEGSVLDQKVVAVGLPEVKIATPSGMTNGAGFFSATSRILLVALGLTGILCLALVGYFVIRKRKVRRF